MCQKDFEKIAALLKDAVNFHGGIVVATREEIVEYLQQEVGIEVPDSAIEHFPLCVRRCGVGITPHKSFKDGSVVVLWDTEKYPDSENVPTKGKLHITHGYSSP